MIFGSAIVFLAAIHVAQSAVLVSKMPMCSSLVEGQPCAIHYDVYNLEEKPITNIRFNDDYGMKLAAMANVTGSTSVKVLSIPPSGHFFHAIVVTPFTYENGDQLFQLITNPMAVQYNIEGEERLSHSTSARDHKQLNPNVFSRKAFDRTFGPTIKVWISFALTTGAPTFMALFQRTILARQYPISPKLQ